MWFYLELSLRGLKGLFMQSSVNRNIILLFIAQAISMTSGMTMLAYSGLAGMMLLDDPAFATVPVSLTIAGTALSTGPLSFLMGKFGRRTGFRIGALVGTIGALTAAYSIYIESFLLLCVAAMLVGVFHASSQYIRFAASESVHPSVSPKAMSYVLVGSIISAVIVPSIAAWFNIQFLPYTFMGAFLLIAVATVVVQIPFALMSTTHAFDSEKDHVTKGEKLPERPMAEIMRQPAFWVAVINAGIGFAMMSFVMTATPLAMKFCGFASSVSAQVIGWHVIGMYLPGLFTGALIARVGVTKVLFLGHIFFVMAFATAMAGIDLDNFSLALVALGIGWNFCFIGGTTLLTTVYHNSERAKVQALNETLIIGLSATASFSAGLILRYMGWNFVNQVGFILLAIASLVTIVYAINNRKNIDKEESEQPC